MSSPQTIVLLRFDEKSTDVMPSDDAQRLLDMADVGGVPTAIVDGFTGFARQFSPTALASGCALQAVDVTPGSSLSTRDVTIDAILRWDFDGQASYAITSGSTVGVVCARGISSATTQERCAYALELRVVNQALRIGEIRLSWHDTSGNDYTAFGGQFQMPSTADNGFMMVTAVRHWVNVNEVQVQYYIGDTLVGDHELVFGTPGDIGGSTVGTFNVGGVNGLFTTAHYSSFFVGVIDELRVRNFAVSAEEVSATWQRLVKWQPLGQSMVLGLMPPNSPISDDPSSSVRKTLKGMGYSFGYAMAQIDNYHQNLLPDRAYGDVQERWEAIVQSPPRASDTLFQRRKRVMSHFMQRQGCSVPGASATVADLLQLAPSQVKILAFSQDEAETFSATPDKSRWMIPSAGVTWTGAGDKSLRFQLANGLVVNPMTISTPNCPFALMGVGGAGKGAHFIATLIESTALPSLGEAGICFANWTTGATLYFGLRNTAGSRTFLAELNVWGRTQGLALLAAAGPQNPGLKIGLHMYQVSASPATYRFEWSTMPWGSSAINGQTILWDTSVANITTPLNTFHWAGFYARSAAGGSALAGALDVKFQSPILRSNGPRPFLWYIYRDPSLPGQPDLIGAQRAAQRLAQAQTKVGVVTNLTALCDDPNSLCNNTPMGGY